MLWNTDTTPWEGMAMPLTLNRNVQVKDGTLVRTDCAGTIVTVSQEHPVQKKGSMLTLGARCGLPTRQLATGFGFPSRPSSSESRNAVLQGIAADLWPTRTGPHPASKRTTEVEARLIRTRVETTGTMDEIADP